MGNFIASFLLWHCCVFLIDELWNFAQTLLKLCWEFMNCRTSCRSVSIKYKINSCFIQSTNKTLGKVFKFDLVLCFLIILASYFMFLQYYVNIHLITLSIINTRCTLMSLSTLLLIFSHLWRSSWDHIVTSRLPLHLTLRSVTKLFRISVEDWSECLLGALVHRRWL